MAASATKVRKAPTVPRVAAPVSRIEAIVAACPTATPELVDGAGHAHVDQDIAGRAGPTPATNSPAASHSRSGRVSGTTHPLRSQQPESWTARPSRCRRPGMHPSMVLRPTRAHGHALRRKGMPRPMPSYIIQLRIYPPGQDRSAALSGLSTMDIVPLAYRWGGRRSRSPGHAGRCWCRWRPQHRRHRRCRRPRRR